MKKLYTLILSIALLCCSSCVDLEEHYNFAEDGSCKVDYGFDMSRAVSILTNLLTDSVRETPQFSLVKDTTLSFYNALPDSSARKLNAEETKIAQGSDLVVKMDLRNSLMKIDMTYQAKTPGDLQYYLQHIAGLPINSPAIDFMKDGKQVKNMPESRAQTFSAGQDYYVYEITNHKFYRVVDKDKFNRFMKRVGSKLAVAKAMLIDMPYKVVMNFAHPVKKIDNAKAMLSADRKTVTLITSMDEVVKNPSVMNLKIDF